MKTKPLKQALFGFAVPMLIMSTRAIGEQSPAFASKPINVLAGGSGTTMDVTLQTFTSITEKTGKE